MNKEKEDEEKKETKGNKKLVGMNEMVEIAGIQE